MEESSTDFTRFIFETNFKTLLDAIHSIHVGISEFSSLIYTITNGETTILDPRYATRFILILD
jgi:hypothetical protein